MTEQFGDLGNLKPADGAIKRKKRIGRGRGSGSGDTATRGHKGQKSRSGWKQKRGFEGGQMPLKRRIPKRGFTPLNRPEYLEIKLSDLERIDGDTINPSVVREARLVRGRGPIVLLGTGNVEKAFNIALHRVTKSAKEKITAAGGSVEILPLDPEFLRKKRGPKKSEDKAKAKAKEQ